MGSWLGQYYSNAKLSGTPALTRQDAAIDFDWGKGSPAPGFPSDRFSVRWTRDVAFDAGTYRFHTISDDGIRVSLDGKEVLNDWSNHSARERTADVSITAGVHSIKVEYYENSGKAAASFWWEKLK